MGDFKRGGDRRSGGDRGGFSRRDGGGGGGRPSFQRRSWGGGGDRDRGPAVKHQAVCDQCGQTCEVPFRPTEGKPVFCDSCFQGKRESEGGRERGGERFSRKSFDGYKAPARSDFQGGADKEERDEIKKQLEMLSVKMDKLIRAIEEIAGAKLLAAEKEKPSNVKIKKTAKKVSKKGKKIK
ncbi:MAG: CxxC-x17-CxxC domain-containing protein [Candidatus Paceibacterota bacterium]